MLSQLINTTKHDNVRIDALRLDGGTQPRHGINDAYVAELAESIVEGATLPPVEVIYDGANYWLYDGFHRVAAHQQAGILIVDANIHQGTQADAQWRSYAANQTHGLRRTNDDKQRAIKAALRHPNGVTMSNREIARHLGVDHKTVGDWREKLEATGEIPQSTTRTGADGRTIDTTNIGTNQPPTVDPWLAALNGDGPPVSVMEIARRLAAVIEPWVAAWVDDKGRTWRDVANRNPQHANSPFRQDLQAELARRGLRLSGMATGEAIRLAFQALSMRDGAQAVTASGLPPLELRTVGAKPVETDEQRRQRIRDNDRRMKEEINSRFASQTPAFVDAVARAAMQTIYDAIPDGDDDEDYDADAADAATVQVIEFDADEPATESEFIPVSQRDDYDSDEWYTPADYIEAARRVMGSIGLDPATSELAQTVVKADAYLTKFDNGLAHIWLGATVWLNPPYSDTQRWVDKLRAEYAKGIFIEQAIILVNNATETAWFQALLTSHPVCLPSRRLAFWRHDHNNATARQGQAIFYLGPNVETFVSEFAQFGPILRRIDQ